MITLVNSAVTTAASARGLVKTYGSGTTAVTALDGVSLDLPPAQLTAVMGPSGSGKSTLMHCMAGLDTADAGEIRIGDTVLTDLDEKERTALRRDRIGFVFQTFNLIPALTAAENIRLPLDLAGKPVDHSWFDQLTRMLGLTERLDHKPTELSGGQQQRVAVARALISRPALVFADEPTGNLDSNSSKQLLVLLQEAVRAFGQTVMMVTHDPAAAAHADRVIFLADGRIIDALAAPSVDGVLKVMRQLGVEAKGV